MAVKVAINGFGRIGRLAFRQMFDAEGYEVVAINDLTDPKMLAHLLKYDSTQGKYEYADKVEAGEDSITVNGKKINIYKEADASKIPWGKHDVHLPDTTLFRSRMHGLLYLEGKGFGASGRRREEGRHLGACRKRSADDRLQRQPQDPEA